MQNGFLVGDSHRVEPSLNSVTGPAGTIRLEPKVMQVLVLLAEHAGQVIAKERLIHTVWPDTFVTDDVLTRAISELRRVFGDDAKESRFIQTIPKSGYRLTARLSPGGADQEIAALRQPLHPGTVATGADPVIAPVYQTDRASTPDQTRWRSWPLLLWAISLAAVIVARWRSWKLVLWAISLAAVIVVGVVVVNLLRADMPVLRVTIAVLPFEHLGGPEREYLTDGLTEETSASLGQIDPDHLIVKGRTSTRRYKNTSKSLTEIGQELDVEYLVEASVQAESGRLRVTAKLIRARNQEQIWAESYDRDLGSLLELQRELSAAIAGGVRLRLSPERLTALARRHTQSAAANDAYSRGRYFWNKLTPETNRSAVDFYKKATQLDPEFALAWSGLADVYSASPMTGDAEPRKVLAPATEAIANAVKFGRDLAETQTAQGTVHYWLDWDWPAAEASFRKAIVVDPGYSQAYRVLGIVLAYLGRHDEAREAMRQARELEPFAPMERALSSHVEFVAGDFKAALRFAQQATNIDPRFWIGQFQLAQVYVQLGDYESALDITERFSKSNSKMISLRGYVLAKLDRTAEAREVLHALETVAASQYVPAYSMALVHAGLNERDAALQSLDRGLQARDVNLIFLVVDPKWDPFRTDPRFLDLLKRCDFMRTASHTKR